MRVAVGTAMIWGATLTRHAARDGLSRQRERRNQCSDALIFARSGIRGRKRPVANFGRG